jgi:hypothetical protein
MRGEYGTLKLPAETAKIVQDSCFHYFADCKGV